MATVPVSDASVQPRPVSPGYQDIQAPSAAFGELQAKSLENAGASIDRASTQLGDAAMQIQAKNDAVARAQDLASFQQQSMAALEQLKTNPKLTDPATTQAFSQQLTDLMNQTIANHSGSPISKAALSGRLALARTQFTTQAAEMASQAQDTLVQSTVGKQLQPVTAAAYNDPSKLMDYFKSADGVVQDMTPAMSESQAAALTNSGREEILKSALQGLIDRGQLDEAQRVMEDNSSLMTPDVQRYFQSHITVARVAQQKAGNDAQRLISTATAVLGRAPTQDERRALLGITGKDVSTLSPSDIISGVEQAKKARGVKDWQATPQEIDAAYGIASKINPTGSEFGNSLTGRAMQFVTQNSTAFAAGLLSPQEDQEYQASVAVLSKPQIVTNKDTGVAQQVTAPLPPFVRDAYQQRGLALPAQTGNTVLPGQGGGSPSSAPAAAPGDTSAPATPAATPAAAGIPATGDTTASSHPTIWQLNHQGLVTGPLASAAELVQSAPGIGNFTGHQMTEARNYVELSARNLVTALQNNPHYAEGERKAIEKDLDILPRSFDNSDAYAARLIATDDALAQREKTALAASQDYTLPVQARQAARKTAFLVQQFREVMGVPPILTPQQVLKLPPGAPYRPASGPHKGQVGYRPEPKAAQ